MEPVKKITVEIAYAKPNMQKIIVVQVDAGTIIEKAIHLSGILTIFPEIDLTKQKIGIFSKQKKLTDMIQHGDRVEIYRPLIIDPKLARKNRVKKK